MKGIVLHSFNELAKMFGINGTVKAKKVMAESAYKAVAQECSYQAANIWAWLTHREDTRKSGFKGQIINSPEQISKEIGLDSENIKTLLIRLIVKGFARPTVSGQAVKAA